MTRTIWFKSCPKCRGDLLLEQDRWGRYRVCIQCGHSEELRNESAQERVPVGTPTPRKAA